MAPRRLPLHHVFLRSRLGRPIPSPTRYTERVIRHKTTHSDTDSGGPPPSPSLRRPPPNPCSTPPPTSPSPHASKLDGGCMSDAGEEEHVVRILALHLVERTVLVWPHRVVAIHHVNHQPLTFMLRLQ